MSKQISAGISGTPSMAPQQRPILVQDSVGIPYFFMRLSTIVSALERIPEGGSSGFLRVIDSKTIAFPSFNGNGMFFSTGNLASNPAVGLLFIDFEVPNRIRFHGRAIVSADDDLIASYPEAELIVRVTLTRCG